MAGRAGIEPAAQTSLREGLVCTLSRPLCRRKVISMTKKDWSRSVRRRANYRCELCGQFVPHKPQSRVGEVVGAGAHHILPRRHWRRFRKEPANGICLCAACHCGIHDGRVQELGSKALTKIHWEDCYAKIEFPQAIEAAVRMGDYITDLSSHGKVRRRRRR